MLACPPRSVVRARRSVKHTLDGGQNALRDRLLSLGIEQIDGRQQQRQRIGAIDADDLAGTAVECIVDAHPLAEIDAGRGADAADDAGAKITDEIAVQIAHDQHIELLRSGYHLHAAIIDDDFARLQFGKIARRAAESVEKQTHPPI